jgi:hypothetical protein
MLSQLGSHRDVPLEICSGEPLASGRARKTVGNSPPPPSPHHPCRHHHRLQRLECCGCQLGSYQSVAIVDELHLFSRRPRGNETRQCPRDKGTHSHRCRRRLERYQLGRIRILRSPSSAIFHDLTQQEGNPRRLALTAISVYDQAWNCSPLEIDTVFSDSSVHCDPAHEALRYETRLGGSRAGRAGKRQLHRHRR